MKKLTIFLAGGILSLIAKTVIDEMKWPLTVITATDLQGAADSSLYF